jgi:molybdopterin synthase sulfur carrier subunit
MTVKIQIPTPLRRFTRERAQVHVEAHNVREALEALEREYPGVRARLCDDTGALRRFVNVYLGEEDIRFLDGLETPLPDGAELVIVPAIAGGRS